MKRFEVLMEGNRFRNSLYVTKPVGQRVAAGHAITLPHSRHPNCDVSLSRIGVLGSIATASGGLAANSEKAGR
jgi:hypothetical protein